MKRELSKTYDPKDVENRIYEEWASSGGDDGCCNTCFGLIALDCCCEMLGGDLIPCC